MQKRIVIVTVLIGLALLSCHSKAEDLAKLEKTVEELALKIGQTMGQQQRNLENLDRQLENLLASPLEELDLSAMDQKQGGEFVLFDQAMSYNRLEPENTKKASVNFLGLRPLTDAIKKEMLLQLSLEDEVIKAASFPRVSQVSYTSANNITLTYPQLDLAPIFPEGLDLTEFYRYQECITAKGEIRLSQPKISVDPAVGFEQTFYTSVDVGGTTRGGFSIDVEVSLFCRDLLGESRDLLLLVHEDTSLIARSPAAREILKIKDHREFPSGTPAEELSQALLLTNQEDSPLAPALAKLLGKGQGIYKIAVNLKTYQVMIRYVPECSWYVIGVQ